MVFDEVLSIRNRLVIIIDLSIDTDYYRLLSIKSYRLFDFSLLSLLFVRLFVTILIKLWLLKKIHYFPHIQLLKILLNLRLEVDLLIQHRFTVVKQIRSVTALVADQPYGCFTDFTDRD